MIYDPTGPIVGVLNVHHGYGRLRRYATRATKQVLVKHDVADHDDLRMGEIRYR